MMRASNVCAKILSGTDESVIGRQLEHFDHGSLPLLSDMTNPSLHSEGIMPNPHALKKSLCSALLTGLIAHLSSSAEILSKLGVRPFFSFLIVILTSFKEGASSLTLGSDVTRAARSSSSGEFFAGE